MNLGGSFDLQVDPAEAERRKRTRFVQLNTQVIPRLRLLGFVLVAACALLHNAFVYPGLDGFSWAAWFRLLGILGIYSLASWYVLYLFYEETRSTVDLGTIFLALDMSMFAVVICSETPVMNLSAGRIPLLPTSPSICVHNERKAVK